MARNTTNNIILKSLEDIEEKTSENIAPAGYAVITLSTKGKLGAPSIVHIRNFKVGEVLALSLTSETDLPVRLIEILNDMILEDTDVGSWNEKEVEELMVYVFSIFYKDFLEDINFPYNQDDIEFLKKQPNSEKKIKDLQEGNWVPKTSFSITSDVSTYDIPDNFKSVIRISKRAKKGEDPFYIEFGSVKYRDQILVKAWMEDFFREDDISFAEISGTIDHNAKIQKQFEESKDPSLLQKLIPVSFEEEQAFKSFTSKKLQILSEILRIITIVNYNGEDVSGLSLSEKYERFANDPMITYGMIQKLNERQKKMKFGIKPEVKMTNPITGDKECLRRFSFRIPSLLYAMQISGADNYDDGYDVED